MKQDNQETIFDFGDWSGLINNRFIPLIQNTDRYLILYGGRGSSKSDFAAKKLIYRCLNESYFLCILVREKYNSIKESSYETLKRSIIDMGLSEFFEMKLSPLEIVCTLNGNRFIARGCDDTQSIKSVKDPTAVWYEDSIISESDFITITSGVRTSKAPYLQEIFSVNPEVEGDYMQHWFWKKFFAGKDELSFSGKTSVKIGNGQTIETSYTVMHSTYKDNRWIRPESLAYMLSLEKSNPYYYTIYTLGRFGNKVVGGTFFKMFQISRNTAVTAYNPKLPLIVSFDFNTKPGVSCGIYQKSDNVLYMIDEILLESPNNNTTAVCKELCRRYKGHTEGMAVTGDCGGRQDDTRIEKGHNDYTIIVKELKQFRARDRAPKVNPSVAKSAEFINDVFSAGDQRYDGVKIVIGEHCTKMIADLLYLLEDSDGSALKKKVTNKETGETYEQYGHFADLFRYAVVLAFPDQFLKKVRGFSGLNITLGKPGGNRTSRNWADDY